MHSTDRQMNRMKLMGNVIKLAQFFQAPPLCLGKKFDKSGHGLSSPFEIHVISFCWCLRSILCSSKGTWPLFQRRFDQWKEIPNIECWEHTQAVRCSFVHGVIYQWNRTEYWQWRQPFFSGSHLDLCVSCGQNTKVWRLKWNIKQYFSVVLFIMLRKVALGKILKCDHSNESYWAVPFIMLCKVALTIQCGWNSEVWPFQWKILRSTFLLYSFLYCTI